MCSFYLVDWRLWEEVVLNLPCSSSLAASKGWVGSCREKADSAGWTFFLMLGRAVADCFIHCYFSLPPFVTLEGLQKTLLLLIWAYLFCCWRCGITWQDNVLHHSFRVLGKVAFIAEHTGEPLVSCLRYTCVREVVVHTMSALPSTFGARHGGAWHLSQFRFSDEKARNLYIVKW